MERNIWSNASIQSGCLPTSQKTAMVTPRFKKSGLDPAAIQNYRPISNLPFMSKVIARSSSWLSSLATWRPTTYSQIINPAFVDITPLRQLSSESSLASTLPSTGTKSPFLPSLTLVQRSTLWITASYSNVFPRHMGSLGWLSPGWSPTSLDACRSSMLVDACLPPLRFILVSLRVQS